MIGVVVLVCLMLLIVLSVSQGVHFDRKFEKLEKAVAEQSQRLSVVIARLPKSRSKRAHNDS